MPPPGINTIFDHLDIMAFSPAYRPELTRSRLAVTPLLSAPSPTRPSKASALSSIRSDHDYYTKADVCVEDYSMVTESGDSYFVTDNNNNDDAMLSSCAVDSEKLAEEGADTDFLKDLDDLDFTFDDPYCEVEMEDSFQDFIDSALDQSTYPPFFSDHSDDIPKHGQNAVILDKEQFLATLQLRPTLNHQNHGSTHSTTFLPHEFSLESDRSLDKTNIEVSCHQSKRPVSFCDVIPTRQCSCVESVFKAVYSTACSTQRECVRTCPSTLVTGTNIETSQFTKIPHSQTPETITSPLFVDTSSNGFPKSFQESPLDCLSITLDDDTALRVDNETADIMRWLSESQQGQPQDMTDGNNNRIAHGVSKSVSFSEMLQENSFVTSSLDLESFVALDDFESDTTNCSDKFESEITSSRDKCGLDYMCQRTINQLKADSSVPYFSQLKLSLLTEHLLCSTRHRHGSLSDAYSDSPHTDKLSPKSSDISYCDLSPSWSRTDSSQSAASPAQLTGMDISLSSNFEDAGYDSSVKSPFALLNLFSDENATSLLHNDTTVPSLRFM